MTRSYQDKLCTPLLKNRSILRFRKIFHIDLILRSWSSSTCICHLPLAKYWRHNGTQRYLQGSFCKYYHPCHSTLRENKTQSLGCSFHTYQVCTHLNMRLLPVCSISAYTFCSLECHKLWKWGVNEIIITIAVTLRTGISIALVEIVSLVARCTCILWFAIAASAWAVYKCLKLNKITSTVCLVFLITTRKRGRRWLCIVFRSNRGCAWLRYSTWSSWRNWFWSWSWWWVRARPVGSWGSCPWSCRSS